MKPFLLAPSLLLIAAILCPALALPCVAGGSAALFGRVVEKRTHEPFLGVVVELAGTSYWTKTDAQGQFELRNVEAGAYRVVVRIPEWGDFERYVWLQSDSTSNIDVVVWPGLHSDMEGVLAYYPMDGTAEDVGPNVWSGVNNGGTPAIDRNGKSGGAMHFDGRTQRIEVAHRDRLNELPLSVAFWVQAESNVVDPSMWLGKYLHPGGDGWCVFYEYNRICAGYFSDTFRNSARSHAGYSAEGKWHHVVVTMDTLGTVIHFDDARVPQVVAYTSTLTPSKNTEPMYIGYLNSRLSTPGLKGSIDDFYVFDHVLSDEEIDRLRKQ